jgi:Cu(I)/Ag(I) efflux system membrane fusion protein
MALVRRKKGDMVQLPDGVVARMQLSPYRVQLAGIQTSLVSFQPLVRRITTIGRVDQLEQPTADGSTSNAIVIADVFMRDVPFLAEGQRAELRSDGASTSFCTGKLAPIESQGTSEYSVLPVRILVDKIPARAFPGMVVTVQIHVPIADLEPYRSMPRSAPPMAPDSLREVYGCAEHPDVIKTKAGKCPLGKHDLERRQLTEDQRVDWWCPMHPQIKSDTPGAECRECDGMKLLPRVVTFTPIGAVLAVPESAVIDTGAKRVVYVERSPGMFDGVEVELGPRCADGYPVISGLEAGQRVATSGSFLIDAETRLNPGVAVGYFGAGTGGKQ